MNTLTIFYDAHCGICSRFRKWMENQPAYVHLQFLPYDSAEARTRCPGIERMNADQEIIVMGDDGCLWQGASAWVICLWALPEYREWSARLASPSLMGMARKIVHWISSNRIGLSRLMCFKSDEELAAAGHAVCETGTCGVPDQGS
jgi:predicted DCC family thiol-disulfide oxidoreductase YuxK